MLEKHAHKHLYFFLSVLHPANGQLTPEMTHPRAFCEKQKLALP